MKTFLVAVLLGIFGAVAVSVSFALHWPAWVMFIAWVSYYIFGKTWQSSLKAFIQIELGIVMGLFIQITGTFLSGILGSFGLDVAVFFFAGSLAYTSRIKILNNIPAWYLGLIIFFGLHPGTTLMPLVQLIIPVISGFVLAWLNDSAIDLVLRRKKISSKHKITL
jgi:Protein of unknown function (DUF1097)